MRQPDTSLPARPRPKAVSRDSDQVEFASRINRGIKVAVVHDVVVITPSEDLGTLRYQEIHLEVGRINDLLRQGGFQKLLIDLSERHRLENVILSALVGFCRSIPGQAALCSVSEKVRESMDAANLLKLWPIYRSRAEALHAMSLRRHAGIESMNVRQSRVNAVTSASD